MYIVVYLAGLFLKRFFNHILHLSRVWTQRDATRGTVVCYEGRYLGGSEPEATIFGRVGGAEEDILIENLRSGGGGTHAPTSHPALLSVSLLNGTIYKKNPLAEVMNQVRGRVISHKLPCSQTFFLQPVDH